MCVEFFTELKEKYIGINIFNPQLGILRVKKVGDVYFGKSPRIGYFSVTPKIMRGGEVIYKYYDFFINLAGELEFKKV